MFEFFILHTDSLIGWQNTGMISLTTYFNSSEWLYIQCRLPDVFYITTDNNTLCLHSIRSFSHKLLANYLRVPIASPAGILKCHNNTDSRFPDEDF